MVNFVALSILGFSHRPALLHVSSEGVVCRVNYESLRRNEQNVFGMMSQKSQRLNLLVIVACGRPRMTDAHF